MNIADTLRGLLRRWYIVFPGIILAIVLAGTAFLVVKPGYQRTATQLLLPGSGLVPEGATNPYLFLGGLTQAADIVVRSMRSEDGVGAVVADFPGTEVEVARDPTTSGPVLLLTVTAKSDAAAGESLDALLLRTAATLDRLQTEQNVKDIDRMSMTTLTEDQHSTLEQRSRVILSAGVGVGVVILTLLAASFVDGMARRAHVAGRTGGRKGSASPDGSPPEGADENEDSPGTGVSRSVDASPQTDDLAEFEDFRETEWLELADPLEPAPDLPEVESSPTGPTTKKRSQSGKRSDDSVADGELEEMLRTHDEETALSARRRDSRPGRSDVNSGEQ
ncbi:hypothetical protein ACH3VR_14510 [Microbacterium sp. B2969]|uniref:Capsular polysaccharide biosynthesis protein n=1 Tax=Microbacterium alkaliflavum TaxID=3248839 RepID=A0ABW7QBR7_9MICO